MYRVEEHRKHFGKKINLKSVRTGRVLQYSTQECITYLLDGGGPLLDVSALCTSKLLSCENLMALNVA